MLVLGESGFLSQNPCGKTTNFAQDLHGLAIPICQAILISVKEKSKKLGDVDGQVCVRIADKCIQSQRSLMLQLKAINLFFFLACLGRIGYIDYTMSGRRYG
jgi:hypothetical protein